jgi:hypothetical protein
VPARATAKGYDVTVSRSLRPCRSAVSRATSGVPSSEPLSTSSTKSQARSSGGSTKGSDGASFFTRSTAVEPGRRPSGRSHGQVMSKSVWPSRLDNPVVPR